MKSLKKLIEELCPLGVEYKKLNEISKSQKGQIKTKEEMKEGPYPVIAGGVSPTFFSNEFNRDGETIALSSSGANAGFVSYWDTPIMLTDAFSIEPHEGVNTKFLYYVLNSRQEAISTTKTGGGIPHVYFKSIANFMIPIPPLPVQEEIVRKLDMFTELTAELTAELLARGKQYDYYRNQLFVFNDQVRTLQLQDVLIIKNGKDYKHFKQGDVPVYGTGGIIAYIDTFVYDKPSVLIPRKGSIDKLYYVDHPFWNVDTIFYTEVNNDIVLTKFVYYYLQSFRLEKLNTAGGVPSLTQAVLKKLPIPIPPISEQQRIVSILDRFDSLVNDISSGLPAEIEARRKQYEYYRDKLLTFKEKKE